MLTAASLNQYLRQKGSPMAGMGAAFIQAGRRWRVDPALLVSIAGAESSFGKQAQGHNPFGWGPGIHFNGWGQAISTVAKGLRTNYLDQGLTSVEQIQQKWAPVHVANDPTGLNQNWVKNVRGFLHELGGGTGGGAAANPSGGGAPSTSSRTVTVPGKPDYAGFAMQNLQEIGAGRPVDAVKQLTSLVDMIRSTPPVELHQASRQTGIPFAVQGKATELEKRAAGVVQQYLGDPYVWGGEKPGAFDCSGLLQYVWAKLGVKIPRVTYDQWRAGRAVPRGALRPGDAVFFRGSDPRGNLPGHVGMYIGGGKFVEAPHKGATVRISNLAGRRDYVGARRYA